MSTDFTSDDLMDLERGLLKLPEDLTELLELFYFRGYSTQEIAKIKGMKQDTIQKKLKKSKLLLKKMLTERYTR